MYICFAFEKTSDLANLYSKLSINGMLTYCKVNLAYKNGKPTQLITRIKSYFCH